MAVVRFSCEFFIKVARRDVDRRSRLFKWSVRVILLCKSNNKTMSNGQEYQSHIYDLTEVIVLEDIFSLPISYRHLTRQVLMECNSTEIH